MIGSRSRALLDRYSLASRALAGSAGERLATEAGQGVEFHDFRQYLPGDELRYADWRVYARTGRLYTRLHRAERSIRLHLLLDTSASMKIGGKAAYSEKLAQLLAYVGQRDSRSQLHLTDGRSNRPLQGLKGIGESWEFIESAAAARGGRPPVTALRDFALRAPLEPGAALVVVMSDLLDEAPLQPALAALRARRFDASFLQVMAQRDLEPQEDRFELIDVETGERLEAGPEEVRAYREAVASFVKRTRAAVLRAGFRHILLPVPELAGEELEHHAFAALVREGILEKR